METINGNTGKKNFLVKTWKRCRSFSGSHNSRGGGVWGLAKSKSWHGKEMKMKMKMKKMAPEGFFPVYVGPDKQRFAVKTKYASHPSFTMLLEDAELEYGYNCDGPLWLPCEVDLFYNVLAEMEARDVDQPVGWSCTPFNNPSSRMRKNGAGQMAKAGCGSYGLLTPSRSIKLS